MFHSKISLHVSNSQISQMNVTVVFVTIVEFIKMKELPTHALVLQNILDQDVNLEVQQDGPDHYLISIRVLIHWMEWLL